VLDPGKPEERHLSLRSSLIIISNTERYATLKLVKEAQVNDGKLDLLVFQSSGLRGLIGQAYSVVRNRLTENKNISYFRVNSAQIQANPPVAAQVDGDFMGDVGPGLMDIKCYPRALQVIVPQKAPDYLFNEH
jgi:diacylglycerol kinase family enzyme